MIKHTHIPQNFVYPEPESMIPAYKFGSNELQGVPLRADGNWLDYRPKDELQERNGVESSCCYIQGQQHAIATILEEQFGIIDSDFSERFNALLSGGTQDGGDPIKGAQSFRHNGLIPDSMLPFSPDITSWEDFHSFKGGSKSDCVKAGKEWLKQWDPEYDIVFQRNDPVTDKYAQLREALKFSPIPMSVAAWYQNGDIYIKPAGIRDWHLVVCLFLDSDNSPWILDTYFPFIKKLEPFYNSDFGMRYSVTKQVYVQSCWSKFISSLKIQ